MSRVSKWPTVGERWRNDYSHDVVVVTEVGFPPKTSGRTGDPDYTHVVYHREQRGSLNLQRTVGSFMRHYHPVEAEPVPGDDPMMPPHDFIPHNPVCAICGLSKGEHS